MWSWLIIGLISLTCLFCFISIVKLELKRSSAKIWIVLTCCLIIGVVGVLVSAPSPIIRKYAYAPKPAKIEIKELPEAPENPAEAAKKVIVIASEPYVRAEASAEAEIMGSVKQGEILTLLAAPEDIDWVNIQTESGLTGWIVKSYVTFLPENPGEQEQSGQVEQSDQVEQSEQAEQLEQ